MDSICSPSILLDTEMVTTDEREPVLPIVSGRTVVGLQSVEDRHANLCNEVVIELEGLDVDAHEDHAMFRLSNDQNIHSRDCGGFGIWYAHFLQGCECSYQ